MHATNLATLYQNVGYIIVNSGAHISFLISYFRCVMASLNSSIYQLDVISVAAPVNIQEFHP